MATGQSSNGAHPDVGSVRLENIGNVIQFMLCMVMVACSSVMVLQLRYLSHTNALGFERENVFAFFNITRR